MIVAGLSAYGKSTFVIQLLECREQLCDTEYENIVRCHSENKTPHHLKDFSLVEVLDYDNPENVRILVVVDDRMDSVYSPKVRELFTKGSHHRSISLVFIKQNLFYQRRSSRDISLNSKFIVMFKSSRYKTQIVHWAREFYPENISSFH